MKCCSTPASPARDMPASTRASGAVPRWAPAHALSTSVTVRSQHTRRSKRACFLYGTGRPLQRSDEGAHTVVGVFRPPRRAAQDVTGRVRVSVERVHIHVAAREEQAHRRGADPRVVRRHVQKRSPVPVSPGAGGGRGQQLPAHLCAALRAVRLVAADDLYRPTLGYKINGVAVPPCQAPQARKTSYGIVDCSDAAAGDDRTDAVVDAPANGR